MFNKLIKQVHYNIFINDIDLYFNFQQYFNQINATIFVYTNNRYGYQYKKNIISISQLPANQNFDYILCNSKYIIDKIIQSNTCKFIFTDANLTSQFQYITRFQYLNVYTYIPPKIHDYIKEYNQLPEQIKNMEIPIFIRTKDRPFYLYTTLKGLLATSLVNNPINIIDDNSTTEIMQKLLYTNEIIPANHFSWKDEIFREIKHSAQKNINIWDRYIR